MTSSYQARRTLILASGLSDPAGHFCTRLVVDSTWNLAQAAKPAQERGIAGNFPRHRLRAAGGAANLGVRGSGDHAQPAHCGNRIVPRRAVYGFDGVLRADLSPGDGSGVHGLPEFSALAGGLCGMPHRTGCVVVRALEAFWSAAGFRGNLPHLFAADSFTGKVPAPGARDL